MHGKKEPVERLSFLERLARFVRYLNTDLPATKSDLVQQRDAPPQKLRQREHKRQGQAAVLIRNREFDILRREMRKRKLQSAGQLKGLSIPSTPPPGRAVSKRNTLHKIDAIERQIQGELKRQNNAKKTAKIVPAGGQAHAGFSASTLRPGSPHRNQAPRLGHSQLLRSPRLQKPHSSSARATLPPIPWVHSAPPIPAVIELAAFDFAEGRDTQVESHLLTAMQTEPDVDVGQQIFQGLLDFYWATGQTAKLHARALDYVRRYGQTPIPRPELDALLPKPSQAVSFVAAEQFDILQLRAFEHVVADASTRLMTDWSALVTILEPQRAPLADAQRAPLADALRALNDRSIELELHGLDMLLAATRLKTHPASAIESALRLQVLRLAGDEAGFVDLAVEISIACACSPVDWAPPRFQRVGQPDQELSTMDQPPFMETDIGAAHAELVQMTARLGGNLSGMGGALRRALRTQARHTDSVVVELHAVRRMDFSAATDLLNWVDAQTQLGKVIELRGAHTLLIPFLQSVGLQLPA